MRKMMDWMHSMKAEVAELKRAQDEEVLDLIHTNVPCVALLAMPLCVQSEAYVGSFNEYTGVGKCINCGATLGLSGQTAF